MTTEYIWQEAYMAAQEGIRERQRVLSEDHGGTAEERQAIVDAINGLKAVKKDVADWQRRQPPGGSKMQPD